ncbi:MAG TPA: hypothetical protein H9824_04325 [Candidatus Bacteroides pullicola]|uniref:Uncharacterized protein n=1 Tax=Candidatus Bacteroides pullicola TaxID=2838475 RepID=A0A9D1ZHN2_9BACE|nr:hypothetical protein [Candidatus Bacteroides pullicola]
MRQLLKDIIIDQHDFLSRQETIIREFPEAYLRNEQIFFFSRVFAVPQTEPSAWLYCRYCGQGRNPSGF